MLIFKNPLEDNAENMLVLVETGKYFNQTVMAASNSKCVTVSLCMHYLQIKLLISEGLHRKGNV